MRQKEEILWSLYDMQKQEQLRSDKLESCNIRENPIFLRRPNDCSLQCWQLRKISWNRAVPMSVEIGVSLFWAWPKPHFLHKQLWTWNGLDITK